MFRRGKSSLASFGADEVEVEPVALALGVDALQFLPPLRAGGYSQPADPVPAGRVAGDVLERLVGLHALAHELGEVGAAAQLADQPRRVPGAALGERLAFDQRDVGLAPTGQVMGDADADHAAADDDDLTAARKGHADVTF